MMIKCVNFTISTTDIGFKNDYEEITKSFGKLYVMQYKNDNIFLICDFNSDNENIKLIQNDKFYIGDIILDSELQNLTNEQIIEYYSNSIVKDIVLY